MNLSSEKLYYVALNFTRYDGPDRGAAPFERLYARVGPGGRFWLELGRAFENRLVSRAGEFTTPWKTQLMPGFKMPTFDPNFKKSFAEITDQRALDVAKIIRETGKTVALFYSGGIDSTVILASLIKNLNSEELAHIKVCMSIEGILENPSFYRRFILGKFPIIDSRQSRYADFVDTGNYAITGDQGDCLFGTEVGLQMYFQFDKLGNALPPSARKSLDKYRSQIASADIHFSHFREAIIVYFSMIRDRDFGRIYYEKLVRNIETSNVPVHSLHDFFWWSIFNVKYMQCALRGAVFNYSGENLKRAIHESIINWFHSDDYQHWSMANNNNGQKIKGTTSETYKWAAREYLYEFDKNDWYRRHKIKISSLKNVFDGSAHLAFIDAFFAVDSEYRKIRRSEPGVEEYIVKALNEFSL